MDPRTPAASRRSAARPFARIRPLGIASLAVSALTLVASARSVARGKSEPSPAAPAQADGGASAADLSPNEAKRRALLALQDKIADSFDVFYGGRWIPHLRAELAKVAPDAPLSAVWENQRALANWLLRNGEIDEAIVLLTDLAQRSGGDETIGQMQGLDLLKTLAVAHLRRAERENCLCSQNGESCVFPLQGRAEHSERRGAEAAAQILAKVLEVAPHDLQSAWLLNIAHQALGSYPDGVPALYRIPAERLKSEYDIGRFEEIGKRVGVSRRSCAGGASVDDFDGDGDLDVIISSMEGTAPMSYYRNSGGRFTDVAKETGLDSQLGGLNFVHGDVNGDGRLDLYVPRGAWQMKSGEIPHSLLLQRADGTFLDVTAEAGVEFAAPSQVAALADIDLDGDLDLFVGCESQRARTGWVYPSRLYANRGDGRFEDVTERAGVANNAYCKGAAFGDYDEDGFPDLYVSNAGAPNRLFHNQGDGTFVDRALQLGVAEPIESFATWWFDANQDGRLDLFVTNYRGRDRSEHVAAYYLHGTTGLDCARIYLNEGEGRFRDASVELGIDRSFFPMGANFGDFDNDGYPDIYLATGDPDFASLWPNVALRNDRGRRFQDVTTAGGFGHLQKGHGVAFGDLDHDGDQDLFVKLGGAFRDDAFWDLLYENPGHGNRWLTVRPQGTRSNRNAIGARIRVRIEEEGGPERDVFTFVGTGGSFGNSSLQAEIGLGRARRIVELEIRWPAAGSVDRLTDVPLDAVISVQEGSGSFKPVPTRPIDL